MDKCLQKGISDNKVSIYIYAYIDIYYSIIHEGENQTFNLEVDSINTFSWAVLILTVKNIYTLSLLKL